MNKILLLVACCLFSMQVHAGKNHKHGAHVHGAAIVSMAFDGSKGEIEIETSADGVIGFEHKPKSAKAKAEVKEALDKLAKGTDLFKFDLKLNCLIEDAKPQLIYSGNHSEIKAAWKVTCEAAPLGSHLEIVISKVFPGVKDIQLNAILDDAQMSFKINSSSTRVLLNK